jgi:hypothetical protein
MQIRIAFIMSTQARGTLSCTSVDDVSPSISVVAIEVFGKYIHVLVNNNMCDVYLIYNLSSLSST